MRTEPRERRRAGIPRMLAATLALAGCGSETPMGIVTGRVERASVEVTSALVFREAALVGSGRVSSAGAFAVAVPVGQGFELVLRTADGALAPVLFPIEICSADATVALGAVMPIPEIEQCPPVSPECALAEMVLAGCLGPMLEACEDATSELVECHMTLEETCGPVMATFQRCLDETMGPCEDEHRAWMDCEASLACTALEAQVEAVCSRACVDEMALRDAVCAEAPDCETPLRVRDGSAAVIELLLLVAMSGTECIRLNGPEEVVGAIGRELSGATECEPIEVKVSRVDGRLRLEFDGEVREVSTAVVAATVVESWAERALTDALLVGPPPGAARVGPVAPVEPSGPRVAPASGARAEVRPEPASSRFGFGVRAEVGLADGAVWSTGLAGRADLRWGPAVVWGGARFAIAPAAVPGASSDGRRASAAAQLGIELPVSMGAGRVAPGVGASVRWSRTARASVDTSTCDRTQCGPIAPLIDDDFVFTSLRPELEAQVRASWPLADATHIEVVLSAAYVVAAESAPSPEYAASQTLETIVVVALPGEAEWLARLGVGLRWGAP